MFELNGVILNAIQDVKDQVDNLKVKLLYDIKGDIISVEADRGRMIQVISNLINNSLLFNTALEDSGFQVDTFNDGMKA